jgi:hypothetical protein
VLQPRAASPSRSPGPHCGNGDSGGGPQKSVAQQVHGVRDLARDVGVAIRIAGGNARRRQEAGYEPAARPSRSGTVRTSTVSPAAGGWPPFPKKFPRAENVRTPSFTGAITGAVSGLGRR